MSSPHVLSIAPMIQWTDRHWRFLFRQISSKTLLYSEMVGGLALINNSEKLFDFIGHSDREQPLAIQLGGNDPTVLGQAAYLCDSYAAFSEINLNCGCPSNKAKRQGFGAELMLEPELVRQILYEMKRRVSRADVTIKLRLGICRRRESWEDLVEFVHSVRSAGVRRCIVHARHCELHGLSPAQNRSVPPLHYEWVYRLCGAFPDMQFVLNGGVGSLESAVRHLGCYYRSGCSGNISSEKETWVCEERESTAVHGVMIGRAAYKNMWMFARADSMFSGKSASDVSDIYCQHSSSLSPRVVLERYLDYAIDAQERGVFGSATCNLAKPLHNFFNNFSSITSSGAQIVATSADSDSEGWGQQFNQSYKRKLDALLKAHSHSSQKRMGKASSTSVGHTKRLDEIIWDAIDGTIPDEILDFEVSTA